MTSIQEWTSCKSLASDKKELNNYKNELVDLRNKLQHRVEQLYHIGQTTTGINIDNIAETWLDAIIAVEEYKARIDQYKVFASRQGKV